VHEEDDDRTETEATPGSQPGETESGPSATPAPDASASDAAGRAEDADDAPADDPPVDDPPGSEGPTSVYCNECGWENPAAANFCSRCGTELQDVSAGPAESDPTASAPPEGTRRVAADLPSGEGEAPPVEETSEIEADEDEEDEQQLMGQQLTLVVGTAVLVVVGLFFVTLWSQSQSWGGEDDNGGGQPAAQTAPGASGGGNGGAASGPATGGSSMPERQDLTSLAEETAGEIPASIAEKVDSLRTRLDEVSGVRARRTKAQLVNLYVGAGENGRAAVLQQEIARSADDLGEWERAANLLYRWMQDLSANQSRQQAFQVAGQAALAYEKVVEDRPDNLDARTRMGETYLLTNNPMKGIEAINGVLEDDSTYVPARFQKGLALLQINRLDQAITQFEAVKRHAEEGGGFYQQAARAIQIIRERSGSGGGAPGGPPAGGATPPGT
jgi:tetratricopeptide (TPR) repeat protein